jgi:hypothetical protein
MGANIAFGRVVGHCRLSMRWHAGWPPGLSLPGWLMFSAGPSMWLQSVPSAGRSPAAVKVLHYIDNNSGGSSRNIGASNLIPPATLNNSRDPCSSRPLAE